MSVRWWGVACAAFQVEGEPADSDWRSWTREPGRIRDGSDADRATEFWRRYEIDLKLAADAGMNAFRLSLAWDRIETAPGVYDEDAIAHYRKILIAVRAHGLEPHVTLHHFVTPGWLARVGGLLSETFPARFASFARRIVPEFSRDGLVREWTTFNEPNVCVAGGYLAAEFPPGRKDDFAAANLASYHLALAHREAVRVLRHAMGEEIRSIRIGIVMHMRPFAPARPWHPFDRLIAAVSSWVFNRQILDGALTGHVRSWFPGTAMLRSRLPAWTAGAGYGKRAFAGVEFIGINYYGRMLVRFTWKAPFVIVTEGPREPKSDLGWEIYPEGLEEILVDTHRRYGLPIVIAENGVADSTDRLRPDFIRSHLASMNRAIGRGVNVEGYLHWTLTDNFEWANGLVPRFGLVEIDYETQERKPRPSYFVYRDSIAESRKKD